MSFAKIKKHIAQNDGDMYVQMLICVFLFVAVLMFMLQVSSAMSQKLWIDEKLNDLQKLVSIQGCTETADIQAIEKEVLNRFGGEITYDCTYVDEDKQTVQLGNVVHIRYYNDALPIIKIHDGTIDITVNIQRQAISEVYYKPS